MAISLLLLAMDTFPVHDITYFLFVRGTIFAAEKSRLGDHHALQNIMRVSDSKLHKQYVREISRFDAVVWEQERQNIVFAGTYAKFTQNPAMGQHPLGTGD